MVGSMSKGDETRRVILDAALADASEVGLEALSIGTLAARIGMSKSGLFAHFGSKQGLQQAALDLAAEIFTDVVIRPAIKLPPGEPRLRAIFENWMSWPQRQEMPGGCLFTSTAFEFDDRPGPVRDVLKAHMLALRASIVRAVALAVEVGHLRPDLDPAQVAFQIHAIVLGFYTEARLFEDPQARQRAQIAFEALLSASRPTPRP